MASSPLRLGDWFRSTVFYEIVVRSFADSNGDGIGDLNGITAHLDYLADLGVAAIWLTPFFRSAWRDEGYDIVDHFAVDPSLGTIDDLDRLVREAHARRIRVVGDLVTNHVSVDHPWFEAARRDRASPYRPYFLWSDTGKEFSRTRVIFVDSEPSNWTWDAAAGQYYFHRFYASQPDLNHDHPAVRETMMQFARFWLSHGLDGLRCDAVPYLFKREGTTSQSLPEVHSYFQELRAMMDREFPGTVLIAEANQTIAETMPYFNAGHEFQVVMHFPLMPNLYLALAEGDARRIRHILQATLPVPAGCCWAFFLRNHDELTLELASDDERRTMVARFGRDPRAVLNFGLRRRIAPMLAGDDPTLEMMHALLLALPGAGFLYYGDEIGMGDRIDLPDRDGVRTPMQWTNAPGAGFSTAAPDRFVRPLVHDPAFGPAARNVADELRDPASLLGRIRRLIAARRASPEMGGAGYVPLDALPSPVLGFWRTGEEASTLCLFNFGSERADGRLEAETGRAPEPTALAGRGRVRVGPEGLDYAVESLGYVWWRFVRAPGTPPA